MRNLHFNKCLGACDKSIPGHTTGPAGFTVRPTPLLVVGPWISLLLSLSLFLSFLPFILSSFLPSFLLLLFCELPAVSSLLLESYPPVLKLAFLCARKYLLNPQHKAWHKINSINDPVITAKCSSNVLNA